ncbi:MAG: hypothetical protein DRI98_13965 [Bacteroidetes bacterium]|nr:MAG: hypothetical protein DRI98_13965 [Bacteroidota bacterium]
MTTPSTDFAAVEFSGSGSKIFPDNVNASTTDFTINSGARIYTAPASLTISGDYTQNGLFDNSRGTIHFNGSVQTLAGTMNTASTDFGNVIFSGATKTFSNNASTSDFTINSGSTVSAPASLSISGDYSNSGLFTNNSGIIYLGNGASVSGTLTGTSAFNDVNTDSGLAADMSNVYSPINGIESFAIDETNNILYIGQGGNGRLTRCDLSTGCDESSDFPTYIDIGPVSGLDSMIIDQTNGVLYIGTSSGAIIYRCDITSTSCDASGDFTVAYDAVGTGIRSFAIDETNNVLYVSNYDSSGVSLFRCLLSTDCDVSGDFTTPYTASTWSFDSMAIDQTNGVLYLGSGISGSGFIYRCDISTTDCDASGDFTTAYDTPESYIQSIVIDETNDVLYRNRY